MWLDQIDRQDRRDKTWWFPLTCGWGRIGFHKALARDILEVRKTDAKPTGKDIWRKRRFNTTQEFTPDTMLWSPFWVPIQGAPEKGWDGTRRKSGHVIWRRTNKLYWGCRFDNGPGDWANNVAKDGTIKATTTWSTLTTPMGVSSIRRKV